MPFVFDTKFVTCYHCKNDDPKSFMVKHKKYWYHKPKPYGVEISCLEKAKMKHKSE